jgi:2-succinyl-5-enolpyruvyl-6-hydroxy-3-cyclohexene-1-carboxylate synthase
MEASEGGTPLVLLTADRPWELHGFGAPQTIAQVGMFGRYVRAAEALPTPDEGGLEHLAAVTARLMHVATASPRGPVHVNVPFREPLAPPEGAAPLVIDPRTTQFPAPRLSAELSAVTEAVTSAKRGLIVCGPRERHDGFGAWVHELGERLGFPVLAEAASNARFGFPQAISFYDALLRAPKFAEAMKPDVVLRFGGGLTAKAPQAWLDSCGARIFEFSEDGLPFDPLHKAEQVLHVSVPFELPVRRAADGYREAWLRAQAALEAAHQPTSISEPAIAREFIRALPQGTNVFLSSSMPIRDVDAFASAGHALRVFTNRGVNGIDGITSTALGVAAGTSRPTALLVGDVALLHDLSGWLIARRHGLSMTVVVVNNDGGGIFHFLPVATRTPHFETLFGTPHGVDLAHVAGLSGARLHRPGSLAEFGQTVTRCLEGGLHLVEVRTDRTANVDAHRALFSKLQEAVP